MSMIKSYAAKEAGGELEVYEYDPGELKPQDVEVQVDYCGICHSDLSMIDNEWGFSQYPLVAGHEVIGRVVALGSATTRPITSCLFYRGLKTLSLNADL